MRLSFGKAQRPHVNETVCGDSTWIGEGERPLIAVVDGLGHGPLAAEASRAFARFVSNHVEEPLDLLLQDGGRAIAHTRGVAASLVRLDPQAGRMWFAGVGNVELRSAGPSRIAPVTHPGILGRPLRRPPRVFEATIAAGDLLVIFSDGISSRLDAKRLDGIAPQEAAQMVLREHGKDHDDATVVVVRCERA